MSTEIKVGDRVRAEISAESCMTEGAYYYRSGDEGVVLEVHYIDGLNVQWEQEFPYDDGIWWVKAHQTTKISSAERKSYVH